VGDEVFGVDQERTLFGLTEVEGAELFKIDHRLVVYNRTNGTALDRLDGAGHAAVGTGGGE
jgi:hypothetical protein